MRFILICLACAALILGAGALWWRSASHGQWVAEPALSGRYEPSSLQYADAWRTYGVYVPASVVSSPPVVIALHGGGGNGARFRKISSYGFDLLADKAGFVVAYPDGLERHWNDCRKRGLFAANRDGVDDVGFLLKLVSVLERAYGIDRRNVVVAGFSNGGQMAYRLALEAPKAVRAAAGISANLPAKDNFECTPANADRHVPVLIVNGTDDPVSPYTGGGMGFWGFGFSGKVRSSEETARYFAQRAGIDAPLSPDLHYVDSHPNDNSLAYQRVWLGAGRPQAALLSLAGGGHSVPHPDVRFPSYLGRTNQDVNGVHMIAQFFEAAADGAGVSLGVGDDAFTYDAETIEQLPIVP